MRTIAAALGVSLIVGTPFPSLATMEDVTCTYDEASKTATIDFGNIELTIVDLSVQFEAIMFAEGEFFGDFEDEQPCGAATISNTDTIRAQGAKRAILFIDESGGPLAPGATAEATGTPEIEIEFQPPGGVLIRGTEVPSVVRLGTLGANINGDDDVDITFSPEAIGFGHEGSPGPDDLAATGGLGTGDPTTSMAFLVDGGGAADRIVGGPKEDSLRGGGGEDVIVGGAGPDLVDGGSGNDKGSGGPGRDTVWGGSGNDTLRGGPKKDRINGDAGRDRCVGGPGNDEVEDCER